MSETDDASYDTKDLPSHSLADVEGDFALDGAVVCGKSLKPSFLNRLTVCGSDAKRDQSPFRLYVRTFSIHEYWVLVRDLA